jgi:hypothetical protein
MENEKNKWNKNFTILYKIYNMIDTYRQRKKIKNIVLIYFKLLKIDYFNFYYFVHRFEFFMTKSAQSLSA